MRERGAAPGARRGVAADAPRRRHVRRVHLDLETDDVAAEVARLIALGAAVEAEHNLFTVLRDPGGVVFCVVPVQTGDDFAPNATTWPQRSRAGAI